MERGSPSPRLPWFETRSASPPSARVGPSAVNVISITRRPEGGIVNIEVRRQEAGDRQNVFGSRESSPRTMMFAGTPPLPVHESRHPMDTRLRGFGAFAMHHPDGSRLHRALADHVRALHGQSLFERFNEPAPPVIDTHAAHGSAPTVTSRRVHTIPIRIEGRNRPGTTERVYEIPVNVVPSPSQGSASPSPAPTEHSSPRIESPTMASGIRLFPTMQARLETSSSDTERKLASLMSQLETEMNASTGSPVRKQFSEVTPIAVSSAKSPPPYYGPHITDVFVRPSAHGEAAPGGPPSPQADTKQKVKVQAAGESVGLLGAAAGRSVDSYGQCQSCGDDVRVVAEACQAMGQLYHTTCFMCCVCRRTLRGKAFYEVQGKIYCEDDYMRSGFQQLAVMCDGCGLHIIDLAVQALGKTYHRTCFRCHSCNQCLDSVPYTVDADKHILCIADYYRLHATKCTLCGQYIVPVEGSDDAVRVVMLDKEYCISCFRCKDCGRQLSDRPDEQCYPLMGILLCHGCHVRRSGEGVRLASAMA